MKKLLISACLLGVCCRYDGGSVLRPEIEALSKKYHLIPICPEIYGGLPTPREPSEIQGDGVYSKTGINVTKQYRKGAHEILKLAMLFDCDTAILKERSPSCGYGQIYDGNFNGTLTEGNGVTAQLLSENGIAIVGESQIVEKLL